MIKVIRPQRISLKYWAACLVADYPNECLPVLEDENNWQEWGAKVAGSGIFAKASIPSPFSVKEGAKQDKFKTWDKWAQVVYTIMSDDFNNNISNLRG